MEPKRIAGRLDCLTRCKFPHNGNYSNVCLALAGRWGEPTRPPDRPDSGERQGRTAKSSKDAVQ